MNSQKKCSFAGKLQAIAQSVKVLSTYFSTWSNPVKLSSVCSELRLVSWWAHSLLRISLAMEKIWNRLVVLNTWSLGACLSRFSSSPGQTALFCCSLVAYHKPISITGSSDACVYVQIQWILEFCYCLKPRGTKITSVAHPETSLRYWKQAVPCRWFGSVASYAWWWEWLSCCLLWVRSE